MEKPTNTQSARPLFKLTDEVARARAAGKPIVALESTVITHGLPWPENLELASNMEKIVRENGAVPATMAFIEGQAKVGLEAEELTVLAQADHVRKVSVRDIGAVVAERGIGGTTVAATMFMAEKQGIRVFATGGIGGVHRNSPFDISTDLTQLSRCPVLVVCAGAKAILDIPATAEYLETQGVPVIGYQTDAFPAFYSIDSGLKVGIRADSPEEVAAIAEAHWNIGLTSGILLVVPPPAEYALPNEMVEKWIEKALKRAEKDGIHGNEVTPYLLAEVKAISGGESMQANLALLLNNARVAAQVAVQLKREAPRTRFI